MRTIAKLAHLNTTAGRSPLQGMFSGMRRALAAAIDRRTSRPLRDIDDWSDQAEVAHYENCAGLRCL